MGNGSPLLVGTERTDTPNRDWLITLGGGFKKPVVILSSAVDAGNTGERTTKLRSGLVLGKITATGSNSGKYKECAENASDGSQGAMGILFSKIDMLDEDAQAADRLGTLLFGPAYVDSTKAYCSLTAGTQTTLSACSTSLTALRGDGMVFKGDA